MRRLIVFAMSVALIALLPASFVSAQVKLSYWAGWFNAAHQAAEQSIVDEFMRQNPDIEVEFVHMANPWEQIPIGHATGAIGDIVISSRDDFPNWQSMGVFRDLTRFIEAEPGFADQFVPQLLPLFQSADGVQYSLPFSANGRGLTWYDYHRFAESGIPEPGMEPWSWDELVDQSRKLARYDDGELVFEGIDIDEHPMAIWTWFWANGTDLWNENFTEATINTPAVRETLTFLHDLIHVHRVSRPPSISGDRAIGTGAGSFSFQGWYQNKLNGVYERRLMWNPYNGDPKYVAMVGGSGMGISARSRHPEEAWRLLRYLVSEEVQWIRFLEGYGTGSFKDHLAQAAQVEESPIPVPQQLYWAVFTHGKPQPTFPRYREWAGPFQQNVIQAMEGNISIDEALLRIEQDTNILLAR